MPHPKMRESIMTPSAANIALADEVLQCNGGIPKCYCGVGLVVHSFACPAAYRPAVALALQSKDDSAALEIARLRAALEPFAALADLYTIEVGDDVLSLRVTLGDLRKARAALQTDGGKLDA